ncbi:MAG: glycosyltransferase family 39 protein [Kiritimatiellales bacterium]|jgi:4-amino-4-deoxy-L-arabinose transferase-like glycosyltransferase
MSAAFRKYALLLLTGLWLVTLIGIKSVPLETHEVYVLQTAQEMQTSGDWILPHFNDSLRLQKPPFSYWATLLISKLDPLNDYVQIWHGRLVSMLSGLLMVLATARAGTVFYGRETGLLAALLLLSTQGFINLSHSARPDFLYSTFCFLQLAAWVDAWMATDGTVRQIRSSLIGWAAAALAMLTKGPQVPAVFLLGILLFLLTRTERKRILRILHPFSGTVLFCVIVLPWWFLLNRRLQSLGVNIADSQLSGSLLHNLAGWKDILSGYYIWTLFVLLLPASLAIPFIFRKLWTDRSNTSAVTRLLMIVCGTLLVAFTLGGHYRKHYLIPLLPIFALFLARAVYISPSADLKIRWRKMLIAICVLATLGGAGLLLYCGAYVMLLILPVYTLMLLLIGKKVIANTEWNGPLLSTRMPPYAILITVIMSVYVGFLPMNPNRVGEQDFSEYIAQTLKPEDLLVEWKCSPANLPFYARRGVVCYTDLEKLKTCLTENRGDHQVFVVLPASELEWFTSVFKNDVVQGTKNYRKADENFVFIKLRGRND